MTNLRRLGVVWLPGAAGLLLLACLASGRWLVAASLSVPRIAFGAEGRAIEDWLVLGPFTVRPETDPWDTDYLAGGALTEATCDPAGMQRLAQAANGRTNATSDFSKGRRVSKSEFIDFEDLFQKPYTTDPEQGAVYACCRIAAQAEGPAYLLVGSADSAKIWLNGEALPTFPARHGVNTYQDALKVDLHRGDNFLLVKVVRWHNPAWGLTVRLEPTSAAATRTALEREDMLNALFLLRLVINQRQYLNLEMRGVPTDASLHGIIRDHGGKLVAQMEIGAKSNRWKPPASLPDGIYSLNVTLAGPGAKTYSQSFCVGNVDTMAAKLMARVRRLSVDPRTQIDLEVLCRRLEILLQPENRRDPHLEREMEVKFVYTLDELEKLADQAETTPGPLLSTPGLHIRGFRSQIDDSIQAYRLFVPGPLARPAAGWPLVIMLAPVPEASRPFLASVFIAEHSEAEHLSAVAARYGLAILWSGYRTLPTGAPCEMTHLDETISEVERDYSIDRQRLYLVGECTGGAVATMASVHWPRRFAAIGLLNPIFDLAKRPDPAELDQFGGSASFLGWLADGSRVQDLLSLGSPPMYLISDGAEAGHGHLDNSLRFMGSARMAGYPATFEQRPATLANHFGSWEYLFRWLVGQSLAPARAAQVAGPTAMASKEPPQGIMRGFAQRFLVVEGTGGSPADRRAIERISGAFQRARRQAHYVGCRVTTDAAASLSDPRAATLVLIGNEQTNRLWKSLATAFPVAVAADRVEIRHLSWSGHRLSFLAILPEMVQGNKTVVLIGGNDLTSAYFGTMNLSTSGWFDYAVWGAEPGPPALLAAGNWPTL
jgi:hypothetical protein